MNLLPKQPLTIKESWLATLQIYYKAFTKIWYLVLVVGIANTIMLQSKVIFISKIVAASFFVGMFLISVYLASLIFYQTYNISNEQNISFKNLLRYINARYFRIATCELIGFLSFLIIFTTTVTIFSFIGYFIFPSFAQILLAPTPYLSIVKDLSITAFFITTFMCTLIVAATPLILFDNQWVWPALKGSCKLVWGNWWRGFTITAPFYASFYFGNFLINNLISQNRWYVLCGHVLVEVLLYPLTLICVLVLFNDLKLRKNIAITTNGS